MEDLTKAQLVLLILLVSFVTSLSTAVVTISILNELPARSAVAASGGTILQRVIQKVADTVEEPSGHTAPIASAPVPTESKEDQIVSAVAKASPAVVSIVASKDLPVVERYFISPFEGDDFLRELFPDATIPQLRERGTERREIGRGTGFIVSSDGYVVTNRHVVADSDAEYTVIMNSGDTKSAQVLARDSLHDIAILKITGDNLPTLPIGDSDEVRIGQSVIAIGNALGEFQNTVSVGIISGVGRTLMAGSGQGGPEELQKVLQTDAAINPGNSGGPLLNVRGEVIGMNTAIVSGAENIGFAVPSNRIARDIAQVRSSGKITYPFLGVRYIIVNETVKDSRKLSVDYGVLLLTDSSGPAVTSGSPAAEAGLKEGDIILEIHGIKITPTITLAELIQRHAVGDSVTLIVRRADKDLSFTVTLAERP